MPKRIIEDALAPEAKVQTTDSSLVLLPVEIACEIALSCGALGFRALAATCRHFRWMLNDPIMQRAAMDRFAVEVTELSTVFGGTTIFTIHRHVLPNGEPHGSEEWFVDGTVCARRCYVAGVPHGPFESVIDTIYFSGAWDHGQKTGTWKQGWVNPTEHWTLNDEISQVYYPRYERSYVGGKRHGLETRSSERVVRATLEWADGQLHGQVKKYFSCGALKSTRTYVAGVVVGRVLKFAAVGQLIKSTPYERGMPNGVENIYEISGKLYSSQMMVDGKQHGVGRTYHSDGSTKSKYTMVDGKKDGTYREFKKNGHICLRCEFVDGKRHGLEKKWHSAASVETVEWRHGKKHGKEEHRRNGGLVRCIDSWCDGLITGEERFYYDGKLDVTAIYHDDTCVRTILHTPTSSTRLGHYNLSGIFASIHGPFSYPPPAAPIGNKKTNS